MISPLLYSILLILCQPDTISAGIHDSLALAARSQVGVTTIYAPGYVALEYPGGDLPMERGVCADVIVRAFRAIGVDLQKEIHEDMKTHFGAYPNLWNLRAPDHNIDHRRVANLMTFFKRGGKTIPIDSAYLPGDVVAWRLSSGLLHIGIVSNEKASGSRYLMIHNIGAGARMEDVLHEYRIIGHYRW